MHDAFTVGIPVLAILFGILWNQQGLRDLKVDLKSDITNLKSDLGTLKADMNARFSAADGRFTAIDGRLDRMQADLSQFYRILGEHGKAIDILEKKS